MALKKCPRCELNYCRKNEEYCDVCLKELSRRGKGSDEPEEGETVICSECGENPAVPGHDLCIECLKEQKRQQNLEDVEDPDAEDFEEPEEDIED